MSIDRTLLWSYLWDLVDEGLDRSLPAIAGDLGVDAVSVAALYHSGKFLLPRNPRRRVHFPEPGAVYFHPERSRYEGSTVQPRVSELVRERDHYRDARKVAADEGLSFQAWVLGYHNTGVGSQHPSTCLQNAFGDRYLFGLCPANPDARGYVMTVVEDLLANVEPDSVFLETHNYLNYTHGFHHEYTTVPTGDVEKYLLSLCFCVHCSEVFQAAGIDAAPARDHVREMIDRRLSEAAEVESWNIDNFAELERLVVEDETLAAVTRARQDAVTGWTREFADLCTSYGTEAHVVASLFARPSSRAWMEGTDLAAQEPLVDGLGVLAYYQDPADVLADVRYAREAVDGPQKVRLALNLAMPDTPSRANLLEKVDGALAEGVDAFGFYNYGFMNAPRIDWLRDAIATIGEG